MCACFPMSMFVHACVCVIIMSWSEAIWVGWLICISGVKRYKYSWPGSKLVWIFILPPGRRRVEWLWFQSAEQKLTQPFVWWTRTLDCRGPLGMLGELHMYVGYYICFNRMANIFDAHHTWETVPGRQRQMAAQTNSTHLGLKHLKTLKLLFKMGEELQGKLSTKVPLRGGSNRIQRHNDDVEPQCWLMCETVKPTRLDT